MYSPSTRTSYTTRVLSLPALNVPVTVRVTSRLADVGAEYRQMAANFCSRMSSGKKRDMDVSLCRARGRTWRRQWEAVGLRAVVGRGREFGDRNLGQDHGGQGDQGDLGAPDQPAGDDF